MKNFKLPVIFGIVCILAGFFGSSYMNAKAGRHQEFLASVKPMNLSMPNVQKTLKKIKVTDVLVQNIKSKKDLVISEVELGEKITWDESFTDWDIFKKAQTISFVGIGKYSTDLAKISADDIVFSENEVTVTVPFPEINSLALDETKTVVESTETGLLRFGDIKITAAEQNELYKKVKNNMHQRLNENDMIADAEEKTVASVSELVQTFLAGAEIYDMTVAVKLK